ncbi:transporter substrate-binding domain-containing protein [Undibacterium seohonense]|uniref:Transporter substrate-binding domain-containing protein n=1 Tax=Undibacterium seohonense TaxID=1344950 RepID=A0ABR6X9S3_9BURK|nr:transporter substrate-binding domain-containing protein [Undibacterium seohonense]MBC3809582.1 transporter substrate-binding domain-containing protein [Undibacterium seohonense]
MGRFCYFWRNVVAMLLLSIQIPALAVVVIRTAAQESSEPKFIALHQNHQVAIGGICVDIFRAIEKRNPEIQFSGDQVWMPRMRIDANFIENRIDAICGVQNIERNTAQYKLLDTPLFSVDYLLAVRADDPIEVTTWEEIRALNNDGIILVLRGFGITDILQNMGGLKIDNGATSSLSNLRKLLAGRGRFYCHRSPGIKKSISQAGFEKQVRLLESPKLSEKFYMGLRKNLPEKHITMINDSLLFLHKSGELKRIFDRYRE